MLDTLVLTVAHPIVLAAGGQGLATAITTFIAPLFLLAIGLAAMTFLFQRQTTQFLQFAAIAVGVALFFYYPDVVKNVALLIKNALS
jgi:hypothetical protein